MWGQSPFPGIFFGLWDAGWEPTGTLELSWEGEPLVLIRFIPHWVCLLSPLHFTPNWSSLKKEGETLDLT